jgi:hypothetical protein
VPMTPTGSGSTPIAHHYAYPVRYN